jgi:hypothetical protein
MPLSPRLVIIAILIVYLIGLLWFMSNRKPVAHSVERFRSAPLVERFKNAPLVERFQSPPEATIDGSALPSRVTNLPTFQELSQRQKPLPCNKDLDNSRIISAGGAADPGETVGSYCSYVADLDPVNVLKKTILGPETTQVTRLNIIPEVIVKSKTIRTANTGDLPVGYNSVFKNERRVERMSSKNETKPGSVYYSDERRPKEFLPPTITAVEAWLGTSAGLASPRNYNPANSSANGWRNISTISSKTGPEGTWADVTEYILQSGLVYTDWIDLPASSWSTPPEPTSSRTIYESLIAAKLPQMSSSPTGADMRMAFTAQHPTCVGYCVMVGDPTETTLSDKSVNMGLSISSGALPFFAYTWAFATNNKDMNMFRMLYNVSGKRLSQKENHTVPFNSWSFPEIKIQNSKTQMFLSNTTKNIRKYELSNAELSGLIKRYEDVQNIVAFDAALQKEPNADQISKAKEWWQRTGYTTPGYKLLSGGGDIDPDVTADPSAIMLSFLRSAIGFYWSPRSNPATEPDISFDKLLAYAQSVRRDMPTQGLEFIIRWKTTASSGWEFRYFNQAAGSSPEPVWLSRAPAIGTKLTAPYQPFRIWDYSVQYTFALSLNIASTTKGYRNIFNHGNRTSTGIHSFPGLGIMGDDGSDRANNIVFNILTQDDSLPYGQTVFIPRNYFPIGADQWFTIVVVINDRDGTIYLTPNFRIAFKLDSKPIWPLENEEFRLSDSDMTSPSDIGTDARGCPSCGTTENPSNLAVRNFVWYPIAVDESYATMKILKQSDVFIEGRAIQDSVRITEDRTATLVGSRTEYKKPGQYIFTVPAGVKLVKATVVGGGGAGGNGIGSTNHPPKGGMAGDIVQRTLQVTPGQDIRVIVGAGGDGVPYSGSQGNPGQNSSFGEVVADHGIGGWRACNDGPGWLPGGCGPRAAPGQDAILPDGEVIGKGGPGKDSERQSIEYPYATGNGAGGGSINCGDGCRADWGGGNTNPSGRGAPGMVRIEWGF